jgi:hypothetical protein
LYDADYFLRGFETGKGIYSNYRWMPEATIPMAHRIIEALGIGPGDRILDFGCACGYLVYAFHLLGRDAHGVDISEWARSQAPAAIRARIRDSLLIDHYEVIIAKDVLEHISEEELPALLQRLRTVGSRILVVVPLGRNGKYIVPQYEADPTHVIRRPLDWWSERLLEAGWAVQQEGYSFAEIKANWVAEYPYGNGFLVGD